MRLPPEPEDVVVSEKDMLILSDRKTAGFIISIRGDDVSMDWLGQLSREESTQSLKAIKKWVSRGIWSLVKAHRRA